MNIEKFGTCQVIWSIDDGRYHMSISHRCRYPTWDEIRDAKHEFIPDDKCMVMVLPKKSHYVNIHENCFHMWELKEEESKLVNYM